MRIVLISDMYLPRRGGIELHLDDLAARLHAAGHTVDVVTPTPGPVAPNVRRLRLPLLPAAAVTIAIPGLLRQLDAVFAAGRYDVAHCHASVFSPAGWAGAWMARKHGIPAVLTFHSVLLGAGRWIGLAYRVLRAARWPLDVTGVSTLVAAQARRATPGREIGVLPNGADVAWWSAGPAARREHSCDDPAALHVVCAMRLTRKKRPDVLLRAVAAACATLPPNVRLRLTLAGDGPTRPALDRLVQALGLGDVVHMPGWRTRAELRALYHEADVFVMPTRDESFGIAALEARAAGLPVIALRSTGMTDFVVDGAHGHLCATDDEIAAQLVALAGSPERLAALRARCRAEPPWAYDWDTVVARHVGAYRAALGEPAPLPASPASVDPALACTTSCTT